MPTDCYSDSEAILAYKDLYVLIELARGVSAVFNFSAYSPFIFLFPFMAPLLRVLAATFPDKGLLKMKRSREIIIEEVATLIRQRRLALNEEVLPLFYKREYSSP